MIAHAGLDHLAIAVVATALVAVYGLAWLRPNPTTVVPERQEVSPSHKSWGFRPLAAWVGGVALVVVASSPWIERLAEESFTGHMVQHLVVIIGAAPLLVLAHPLRTLQRAGWIPNTAVGRRLGAWWHRAGPLLAAAAFVVVLFATHLTSLYDDALGNRWLHEAEHAAYLASAVAIWAAVLAAGRAMAVARVGAVFGVIVGMALLGMILLAATEPLMPTYSARLGHDRALDDQRTAAAVMWVTGMLTTLPLMIAAVWRWAATEQRIALRAEALSAQADQTPAVRSR